MSTFEPSGFDLERHVYNYLDRREITLMIKALRKARDQVFGADE